MEGKDKIYFYNNTDLLSFDKDNTININLT